MKWIISISLAVYFVLLIILVLNMEDKSKIIKNSFLLFIISLVVALFFVNELIMDYIISIIIKFIYFPSFAAVIAVLLIAMGVFIICIFNDEISDKVRIINYIFASYIFVSYIIFMFLEVDVNSYNALYDGNSLLCLRYISRTSILWLVTNIVIKYFSYFLRKKRA